MKKIILLIIIVIIILGGLSFWWFGLGGKPYEPTTEADERFGFLVGPSPKEYSKARDLGAGWIRPHPGPFVWRNIQSSAETDYDFSETDKLIKEAQKYKIKVLATLWPYAPWDQQNYPTAKGCQIKSDEFSREFGNYRCNPYDWKIYASWIRAVVERYDGDGADDMPGLTTPITHWEVFNEPDLQGGPDGGLQFYVGDPTDYAELLQNTYINIKNADPNATVLIAGAAGGNDQFLNFYRGVFAVGVITDYFDIANVHCITNDDYASFNVEPYAKMLAEFNIDKPIWVTEAETFISKDLGEIGTQLQASTKKAFSLGAEKVFYTAMNFEHIPGGGPPPKDMQPAITVNPSFDLNSSEEIYKAIFNSL